MSSDLNLLYLNGQALLKNNCNRCIKLQFSISHISRRQNYGRALDLFSLPAKYNNMSRSNIVILRFDYNAIFYSVED